MSWGGAVGFESCYYKKQWLNQLAYDMIKEDVNYLINNL